MSYLAALWLAEHDPDFFFFFGLLIIIGFTGLGIILGVQWLYERLKRK